MARFSHSLGISVGIHVTALALVILIVNYRSTTPLPPANASLANAIAVSVVPPPQPPSPPQPPQPTHPQSVPPVPQPPPQTLSTQSSQADLTTPPPKSAPLPTPQPPQNQVTPQQATYAQIVSAILKANKRYPRQALIAGQQGTVILSFIINHQGTVLAYRIEQSSGQPILDEAVRRLIEHVHFPPFPSDDTSQRKSFKVPIVFTLNG